MSDYFDKLRMRYESVLSALLGETPERLRALSEAEIAVRCKEAGEREPREPGFIAECAKFMDDAQWQKFRDRIISNREAGAQEKDAGGDLVANPSSSGAVIPGSIPGHEAPASTPAPASPAWTEEQREAARRPVTGEEVHAAFVMTSRDRAIEWSWYKLSDSERDWYDRAAAKLNAARGIA